MKIPFISFLRDVITGKAKLGQQLHKVLPFKKARTGVNEVLKGVKDLLPVPQIKDASIVSDAEKVKSLLNDLPEDYAELNKLMEETPDFITNKVYQIRDMLDDGRINGSADDLSADLKYKLRLGTSIVLLLGVVLPNCCHLYRLAHITIFKLYRSLELCLQSKANATELLHHKWAKTNVHPV